MNQQKLYVAWQCYLGHRMAQMVSASHAEGMQRLHQKVEKATQDSWLLWSQGLGGNVVLLSGSGEGIVSIPVRGLPQVAKQRQRFKTDLGEAVVSVGIGTSIEKALKARELAAKRGGETPVLWSTEVEAALDREEGNDPKALNKALAENPGAHGGFGGFSRASSVAAPAAPAKEASEHSEGEAAMAQADTSNAPPPPEMTHAATDLIDNLHSLAGQEEEKQQGAEKQSADALQATKKKVAQVLEQVKQQAPMLGQLKAASPAAYASVEALIQSVIALARAMSPDVKKSKIDIMDGVSEAEAKKLATELKVDLDTIDPEEWKKGVAHEREHADVSADAKEIAKIALAHLKESPSYYSDLEDCMPLEKKLGDIAIGKPVPTPTPVWDAAHDYSHVLTPGHRDAGYSMHVLQSDDQLAARIYHNGRVKPVGGVLATNHPNKGLEVDVAEVAKEHAGKGLGSAAYEALMAHAKNALGTKTVFGGLHSTSASATHAKVAAKHGMDYTPTPSTSHAKPSGPMDDRFGQYAYTLKDEIPMEKDQMAFHGPRHHLNLPPGTMLQGGPGADRRHVGKIKVKHGDGSTSWVQARSGMVTGVADRNAPPTLGQAGHPLSSRNPTGH